MVTLALRCVAFAAQLQLAACYTLTRFLPLPLFVSLSLSVCLPFRRSMVTLSVSGLVVDCLIPLPAPSRSPFPSPFPSPLPRPGWLSGYLVGWLSAWLPPILSYIPQTNATNQRSLDCPAPFLSLPPSLSLSLRRSSTRFAWTSAIPILQLVIPMLRCRVVSFLH